MPCQILILLFSPRLLPDTTVAPKKRPDKSKNKAGNGKARAFDLGKADIDDNVGVNDVLIMGTRATDGYICFKNVDPNKVRREKYEECMNFLSNPYPVYLDCHTKGNRAMESFWRELVPDDDHNLCNDGTIGWLSDDQMNAWMEIVIRNRPHGARFTVAKAGTASKHPRSQQFIIVTDEHMKGTLDGTTRPYPSWDDVDWVYMSINTGGNHWVTGAINLPDSKFYVLDSLESDGRISSIYARIRQWTITLNGILEEQGRFERTERQPYDFQCFYNQGFDFQAPQQANHSDCGVVTCFIITSIRIFTKGDSVLHKLG
ncbi:phospholipase-like protein [Tanacetum coccineum]